MDNMNIQQLFDRMKENGFRRPTVRMGDLIFKRAPDSGANRGGIYITTTAGTYLGKILRANTFLTKDGASRTADIAEAFANPIENAVKHGRQTGECSICGRRLDNSESIRLGIGPICAEKVGAAYLLTASRYGQATVTDEGVDFSLL